MKRCLIISFLLWMGFFSYANAETNADARRCALEYAKVCEKNPAAQKEARELGITVREYCSLLGMTACGLLP